MTKEATIIYSLILGWCIGIPSGMAILFPNIIIFVLILSITALSLAYLLIKGPD